MKMKLFPIVAALYLTLAFIPNGIWALSGGESVNIEDIEGDEDEEWTGEVMKLMDVATKFRDAAPELEMKDALDLAKLLLNVKEQEQTKLILESMKSPDFSQDPDFQNFISKSGPKEIVVSMHQILDELKAVEVLFSDPKSAVEEIYKDGMIDDEERLKLYRKNPTLLEEDMRSGLYLSFVSFAVAGGHL